MTKQAYALMILLSAVLIFSAHFLLLHFGVVSYWFKHFVALDIVVFALFFIALPIILVGKVTNESFVMRFMGLTTFQLLGILSIVAAVIYSSVPMKRHIVYNLLGVFLSMLVAQSIALAKYSKSLK